MLRSQTLGDYLLSSFLHIVAPLRNRKMTDATAMMSLYFNLMEICQGDTEEVRDVVLLQLLEYLK